MEFLDEESRPRFLFQSRVTSSSPPLEPEIQRINKPIAFICVSISLLVTIFTIFFLESEVVRFLFFWVSIAFCVGPFAPISITGGDIAVGRGDPIQPPDLDEAAQIDERSKQRVPNRRNKSKRSEEPPQALVDSKLTNGVEKKSDKVEEKKEKDVIFEETEWTDGDFDLLKKQISKHPVGTPSRWELIAEAFKGRHGTDSVIKMAKSTGERKPGGGDSFSQFLKQRKPLDKRVEEENVEVINNGEIKKESVGAEGGSWTSTEDIALLNALKAFPKDVPMRWEKIAVAVPGRSKTSCMKRVAELKKGFRTSKASVE